MTDIATEKLQQYADMLADCAAERTRLDLRLDAERDSADRLSALVAYLLAAAAEHDLAVLVAPAASWFTVGDLMRAELARHAAWRLDDQSREQNS